jgi:nucleoside-diphosphate-sugar epimerase
MIEFKEIRDKYKVAIVTGGAGFIGSHIVEELLKNELKVRVIDNFSAGKIDNLYMFSANPNLEIIDCDVSNIVELREYFKNVDIVFHNAASKKNICLIDPSRDLDVNAKGTLNVMLLSKEFAVKKVIHASTGSIYGEPQILPLDEEHPLNPTSYYGVSKLAGERYVDVFNKIHGINTTVLRYFHVYGPRQETDASLGGVIAIFINNLLNSRPIQIHGDGNQLRSFTYVKDIVAANILAAIDESSNGKFYNVASGIKVTINDLVNILKSNDAFNSDVVKIEHIDSLIGDIRNFEIDNKSILELGINFTEFKSGLLKTIDYYQNDIRL